MGDKGLTVFAAKKSPCYEPLSGTQQGLYFVADQWQKPLCFSDVRSIRGGVLPFDIDDSDHIGGVVTGERMVVIDLNL